MNPNITRDELTAEVERAFTSERRGGLLSLEEKARVRDAVRTLSQFVPTRFWSDTHGCGCIIATAFPEYMRGGCTDNMPDHLYTFGADLADVCGLGNKYEFDTLIEVVD